MSQKDLVGKIVKEKETNELYRLFLHQHDKFYLAVLVDEDHQDIKDEKNHFIGKTLHLDSVEFISEEVSYLVLPPKKPKSPDSLGIMDDSKLFERIEFLKEFVKETREDLINAENLRIVYESYLDSLKDTLSDFENVVKRGINQK